jgi:hypothetical protein
MLQGGSSPRNDSPGTLRREPDQRGIGVVPKKWQLHRENFGTRSAWLGDGVAGARYSIITPFGAADNRHSGRLHPFAVDLQ